VNIDIERRLLEADSLDASEMDKKLKSRLNSLRYQDFLTEISKSLVSYSLKYTEENPFYVSPDGIQSNTLMRACCVMNGEDYRACGLGRRCKRARNNRAARANTYCDNPICVQYARPLATRLHLCVRPPNRRQNPSNSCYNVFHRGEIRLRKKRRRQRTAGAPVQEQGLQTTTIEAAGQSSEN